MNVFNATLGVLWRSISAFFVDEYEQEDAFKNVPMSGVLRDLEDMPACGGVLCAKRAHSVTCPRKVRAVKKAAAKKSSAKKSSAKKKSAKKSPAKKSVRKKSRA